MKKFVFIILFSTAIISTVFGLYNMYENRTTSRKIDLSKSFSTELINKIIAKRSFSSYLQLGVRDSYYNYLSVNLPDKTSVAPFIPNGTDEESKKDMEDWHYNCSYIMSYDDFFYRSDKHFDLIYINDFTDKSHMDKNIAQALKALNNGGYIILHENIPITEENQTHKTDDFELWHTNVWKILYKLTKFNSPNLDIFLVDRDWGIGVIQKKEMSIMYRR